MTLKDLYALRDASDALISTLSTSLSKVEAELSAVHPFRGSSYRAVNILPKVHAYVAAKPGQRVRSSVLSHKEGAKEGDDEKAGWELFKRRTKYFDTSRRESRKVKDNAHTLLIQKNVGCNTFKVIFVIVIILSMIHVFASPSHLSLSLSSSSSLSEKYHERPG